VTSYLSAFQAIDGGPDEQLVVGKLGGGVIATAQRVLAG
jgi:hypothetical protein